MQSKPSLAFALVVAFLIFGSTPLTHLITDAWWFDSMGHYDVFRRILGAQIGMGTATGLIAFALVGGSGWYAARASGSAPLRVELRENPLGQVLQRLGSANMALFVGAAAGLVSGLLGAAWWEETLLFVYGGSFGATDPVLEHDIGFYIFRLPLLLHLRQLLVLLAGAAAVLAGLLYLGHGAIRLHLVNVDGQLVAKGMTVIPAARRHLAVLAALVLFLMAGGALLERYTLLYTSTGLFAGPGYSDLFGTLPMLSLRAMGAVLGGALLAYGIERLAPSMILAAGVAVVTTTSVAAVYPGLVQRFSVEPNEFSREAPAIRDHIEGTRIAWGLDSVKTEPLAGTGQLSIGDITSNRATIDNIRLWDHVPLLETFSQVQEIRTYYTFNSVDNDRYTIDGELRQIMLSPRELDVGQLPVEARRWVNQTMTYTHGYGLALGPVNEVNEQGLPRLFVQDIPPTVEHSEAFRIDRPQIYFGEVTTHPVFVNTSNPEFDYPAGDENMFTHYDGPSGVKLSSVGRALFAYRFASTDLLLSGDITPESKVLMYRDVRTRVAKIAPFLIQDTDPYMVIADGNLVWLMDAYTSARTFPYSKAVGDSNYLRAAAKVTIDAYDGTVKVYIADTKDPITQAWKSALPGLFHPLEEMPATLKAHLRYPTDLFSVQAHMFATYHMKDHQIFYNREDEWEIPQLGETRMKPYFTVMNLPGEDDPEFIQMLPYSPRQKANLAAWLVARSDGDNYGDLRVYPFGKDTMVYGPKMVLSRINQDDAISEKLSLWNQQGSEVNLGTLLVIPVGDALLYVQPLYMQAASGSIPELKRVIVAYEDSIAMQPTLRGALNKLFGEEPAPVPVPAPVQPAPIGKLMSVAEWTAQAQQHFTAAQAAVAAGDWATYGAELDELERALRELSALTATLDAPEEPPSLENP